MKNLKAHLVILSAPSGCGKDTIARRVRDRMPEVGIAVSCTTRAPRKDKITGKWEQHGPDRARQAEARNQQVVGDHPAREEHRKGDRR